MTTAEELHANTRCQIVNFSWILAHFREFLLNNKDKMPLFDIESSERESGAGNRCLLAPEHALLMGLMRKRINTTQEQLVSLFDIDQTTMCGYLRLVDEILGQILPTTKNVSKIVESYEQSKIQDTLGNTLLVDGTYVPVQRPEDSVQRDHTLAKRRDSRPTQR